ncbi:STAS/SEC14 domain-containing protein [uncultured Pontibacter sp.]|uniref:STAS/SEC14 domain-containing protein n=1 Tax=uncultured Pontibacter sp. TaxID=453356 RepID=UPI002604A44C|nr:STAS/SEC14 domain-containing protein [uncultured Pontibacter sp.]
MMLEILPETHDNILAVRVRDKLTIPDFDQYRNMVRDLMLKNEETHIYYEMVDVDWINPVAAIENGLFDVIHGLDYGRVAMVGEKKWQELSAKLASTVKKHGIRYYDLAEKEQAMRYVLEGDDSTPTP